MSQNCYCGLNQTFENCCEPFLKRVKNAPTAEKLMRSRYCAYVVGNADYLLETTHKSTRKYHFKSDVLEWSKSNKWVKLEIIISSETIVEFKAYFLDFNFRPQIHHEKSTFKFENEKWYYVDGIFY